MLELFHCLLVLQINSMKGICIPVKWDTLYLLEIYDLNISAQVLVVCLLALNLVGAAEEEVQEEATGEVF